MVDATGFKTTVRRLRDEGEVVVERWHDQKHKEQRFIHDWVKLYAATGTLTNVVTAARVTLGTGTGSGDSLQFKDLVNVTDQCFQLREVSADKAYLAAPNLDAIAAVGALPFVPFKTNSGERAHPERALAEDVGLLRPQG